MRILLVANPAGPYLARWTALLADRGWQLRVFSPLAARAPRAAGRRVLFFDDHGSLEQLFRHDALLEEIAKFRPDVVHSFDTFDSGDLVLAAHAKSPFAWIATSLGNDVDEFATLPKRKTLIRKLRAKCDRFVVESESVTGRPVVPHGAGFLLGRGVPKAIVPPSRRRAILLEGNFDLYGRSLVALTALERCRELLGGYELLLSSPTAEIALAAGVFERRTGLRVTKLGPVDSVGALARYARAAVSINLSISHGLNATLLEAMRLGAMPLESSKSYAAEWIVPGETGFLVDPDDSESVESALRQILAKSSLLDQAAAINAATLDRRLEKTEIHRGLCSFYESRSGH